MARAPTYIRFTVRGTPLGPGRPIGVLHAIRYLRDDGVLTRRQEQVANQVFDWLFAHLPAPSRAIVRAYPTALSWYRSTARKAIAMTRRLEPILKDHGCQVVRTSRLRPGRIVYSDAQQVFAVPRGARSSSGRRG